MIHNKYKIPSKFKGLIFICSIPIVFAMFGFGVYFLLSNTLLKTNSSNLSTEEAISLNETYKKANNAVSGKDASAGQAILDNRLKSAKNNNEKALIYGAKASLASSSGGDYKTGLEFALKSDQLNQTYSSAALIAKFEEKNGNTKKSIEYYQIAIKRVGDISSAGSMAKADYNYYQKQIERLNK